MTSLTNNFNDNVVRFKLMFFTWIILYSQSVAKLFKIHDPVKDKDYKIHVCIQGISDSFFLNNLLPGQWDD